MLYKTQSHPYPPTQFSWHIISKTFSITSTAILRANPILSLKGKQAQTFQY